MYHQLLPSQGHYCLVFPGTKINPTTGKAVMVHKWYTSVDALMAAVEAFSVTTNVYIAQSSFKEVKDGRKKTNANLVRSFWIDIDCGAEKFAKEPHKSYPDQVTAGAALKKMCEDTGLPLPTVVNSGNGLYAHWVMLEDVYPERWHGLVNVFKSLLTAVGFKQDPTRTADIASILRPVGAINRKDPDRPKKVQLVHKAEPIAFEQFSEIIRDAARKYKVECKALMLPKAAKNSINAAFLIEEDYPPSHASFIAEHCNQIRRMRDTQGDIDEPHWYAAIGVLRHCVEGNELIHAWSNGHPNYTPEETEAKIAQHTLPPTTCSHFGSVNPHGCVACKYNNTNKIKSPIQLGMEITKVLPVDDEERCPMPAGFILSDDGIYWEEDRLRIIKGDFYPVRVNYDASMHCETVTFRHYTKQEGWNEVTFKTSLHLDPRSMFMALQDQHVQISGADQLKMAQVYIVNYIDKLRERTTIQQVNTQMGWKGEDFILGEYIYRKGSEPVKIGLAKNVPEAARFLSSSGDLKSFVRATKSYDVAGSECYRFNILSALAAPLIKFTGYEGALVSCVGKTGTGKTLSCRVGQAVWGDSNKLIMFRGDTTNSIVSRLGVFGSLPLVIDEASNMEPLELSDLVYRVTQGRDKARLTKNAVEKAYNNAWNTLAVTSSNHSLIEKLALLKSDASAEMNRVFEYYAGYVPALNTEVSTGIYRLVSNNYGVAGPIFIQYLVDNYEHHQGNIDKLITKLRELTDARPDERYQMMVIATVIYAGLIAKKLGLIAFSVEPLIPWAVNTVISMRKVKHSYVADSVDILGQFLSQNASNVIVVTKQATDTTAAIIQRLPTNKVVCRIELDTMKCYISLAELKAFVAKTYGSLRTMKFELKATLPLPTLLKDNIKRSLTNGVSGFATPTQMVWELDLNAPQMGMVLGPIVHEIPDNERKEVE